MIGTDFAGDLDPPCRRDGMASRSRATVHQRQLADELERDLAWPAFDPAFLLLGNAAGGHTRVPLSICSRPPAP